MNAVIYARYSSDNQREESIEGQLRECKEYADQNGITVVRTYIDRALSAKTDSRPQFQQMIHDSATHTFEAVLVWKLDRFSRNRYDSAHYKRILKNNRVHVVSVTESISNTPEGIMLESLLEGMAEYYSAELAEKVSRGHKENALKAKFNGGPVPLGYRIDSEHHYQIDPNTAPVVQEAFHRYAAGESINNVGFWDSIPLWAVTLIGGLLITVLSFTMILTVYGRMFSLWMYAAIAPIPLSTFAGEPTSSVGKNFIRSYAGVCLQGVVIALSCIIFSAISSSPPAVDTGASVVTAVWTYVGELAFNLLVLVGAIKGCDRIVKEIMGL